MYGIARHFTRAERGAAIAEIYYLYSHHTHKARYRATRDGYDPLGVMLKRRGVTDLHIPPPEVVFALLVRANMSTRERRRLYRYITSFSTKWHSGRIVSLKQALGR